MNENSSDAHENVVSKPKSVFRLDSRKRIESKYTTSVLKSVDDVVVVVVVVNPRFIKS